MSGKQLLSLAKRTYGEWTDDHGWIFAAAMASFAALSFAPILLIAARAASLFGERHAFSRRSSVSSARSSAAAARRASTR